MGCLKIIHEPFLTVVKSPANDFSFKGKNDAKAYRYGFNGMEKDDEVKGSGNSYDYIKRFYDSRLGRFLSIDPITADYPYYSPYQFAGNKPIIAIDRDGLEEYVLVTGVPNMVNGIVYIRVDKAFYINREYEEKEKAVHKANEAHEKSLEVTSNKKDIKALNAAHAERLKEIDFNYQLRLAKIDKDFKKVKTVAYDGTHTTIKGADQLYYILKQGDMKDNMSSKEMEMFNGGGALIDKIAGDQEWKKFIETPLNV
jgi:RHS repeat-associated protein